MTEIPEHLLKRAQEAREKAAAESRAAEPRRRDCPRPVPSRRSRHPIRASRRTCSSAAGPRRRKTEGRRRRRGRWRRRGRRAGEGRQRRRRGGPRRRGVPLGAGPGGHTQRLLTVVKSGSIQDVKASPDRQGPHLAAPARRRVRRRAGVHGVHVLLLDLGQRPAAAAGQPQPDAEPVEGAVVLPRPARAAHDVPPDDRRRHHSRRRI